MRFLVAGAGSWGTAFTRVLLERGHEVVLACRTPEQADAIAATGWNPHHLQGVDLRGAEAVPLAAAPGDVDVVAVAVPSKAFAVVVRALPGDAPVLSLVKGLDPETGERLSTRVQGRSRGQNRDRGRAANASPGQTARTLQLEHQSPSRT